MKERETKSEAGRGRGIEKLQAGSMLSVEHSLRPHLKTWKSQLE